jgi:hypothetical protein
MRKSYIPAANSRGELENRLTVRGSEIRMPSKGMRDVFTRRFTISKPRPGEAQPNATTKNVEQLAHPPRGGIVGVLHALGFDASGAGPLGRCGISFGLAGSDA